MLQLSRSEGWGGGEGRAKLHRKAAGKGERRLYGSRASKASNGVMTSL